MGSFRTHLHIIYVVLSIQCIINALGTPELQPIVHLRTGVVQPQRTGAKAFSSNLRRRLFQEEHRCHTESSNWGMLHSTHQVLASHPPSLTHEQHVDLVAHLESAGTHIVGYIPDNTLMLVGSPESLERAANHSHIVWMGDHEHSYKRAPEWDQLLSSIKDAEAGINLKALDKYDKNANANGDFSRNSTLTAQLLLAASLAPLPVDIKQEAGQWPLIGIQVVFPALHMPQPLAGHHYGSGWHNTGRMERVAEHKQGCHAGKAAIEDWEPLLQQQFSPEIQVHSAGEHAAVVFAPVSSVAYVIDWLSKRPSVQWIAPQPKFKLRNRQASSIIQADRSSPSTGNVNLDPSYHPLWAAGVTGKGQVIGIGDSGIDHTHCFFTDPNVDWNSNIRLLDGVRTFSSEDHRKIRMYRGFKDLLDDNGHGSHVSGTAAGMPYGTTLESDTKGSYIGMAPDAKIAFFDFSSRSDGDAITTPYDLVNGYFAYTTAVGATVHSDSWGSNSILYDREAAVIDSYCWENQRFLPVFPAGNAGDYVSNAGSSGESTINSPATSKNCLAVGATQSQGEQAQYQNTDFVVFNAVAVTGPSLETKFRVLQSTFGPGIETIAGASYPLSAASPLKGCTSLDNAASVAGTVVMLERGDCDFKTKATNANAAGAIAAIFYDNEIGAYFIADASSTSSTITIPSMSIPRRIGQNMMAVLTIGRAVTISFQSVDPPTNSFDNLADYSSQGPTAQDFRVKPDIVAPGTVTSAQTGRGTPSCGLVTYGGTSMATPVVAGSALLVRQYFLDGFYPSGTANAADRLDPSSALVKAILVSGAASLEGFEADTGLPIDPPPSYRQGFGRIFLGRSLYVQNNPYNPTRLQVLDLVPITTGETHQFCVRANGGAITITLVWTDYPGSPISRKALVNDLDLTVRAEGFNGIPVLGNGGSLVDSSKHDSENNIEQVYLPSVPAGQLSVEVKGSSVQSAFGPQPYSIVINGDFTGTLIKPSGDIGSSSGECAVIVPKITAGPPGLTNQAIIQFEFSTQTGSTSGVSFECKLGDTNGNVTGSPGMTNWVECRSPVKFENLPDGGYQFSIRARGETIATSQNFVKDATPPAVSVDASAIPATTPQPTASLIFSAADTSAVSYSCSVSVDRPSSLQGPVYVDAIFNGQLTLGTPFNCTSPKTLFWLLPGAWKFSIEGSDAAGNKAPIQQVNWNVAYDPAKRYARFLTAPYGKVPKMETSFAFSALQGAADGGVTELKDAAMECSLTPAGQPAQWSACSSPFSNENANDGAYRFMVRLAGDVGSGDPVALPDTWAVSDFEVDSTPPVVTFTSSPAPVEDSSSVSISFAINEEGSTAQCKLTALDASDKSFDYKPCFSPETLSNLTDGRHVFEVRAKDLVGNIGSPAVLNFTVDGTPPSFSELNVPLATTTGEVTISFTPTDGPGGSGIKNVTCRMRPIALVDQGADLNGPGFDWAACTSPITYQNLKEGHYSFGIQAFDNANLASEARESDVYQDTKPPVTNITGAPAQGELYVGSRLTFNLTDGSSQPLGTTSPIPVWSVLLRSITAEQYAALQAGNLDVLDPIATGSGGSGTPPLAVQKLQSVETFRVSKGVARWDPKESLKTTEDKADGYQLKDDDDEEKEEEEESVSSGPVETVLGKGDVGKWANCTDICTYKGLSSGYYAFQATGTDAAGNAGSSSPPYWLQYEATSSGLSQTAIIAIAVGSGLAFLIVVGLVWWACRRKNTPSTISNPAFMTSPQQVATNGYYPNGYGAANGYSNVAGTPLANGAATNWNGATGAAPGAYAAYPTVNGGYLSPAEIERQQVALALAESKREARQQRRQQSRRGTTPQLEESVVNDPELRAAIEASLKESGGQSNGGVTRIASHRMTNDELVQMAIEQSLIEQEQQNVQANGTGSIVEWPPRR